MFKYQKKYTKNTCGKTLVKATLEAFFKSVSAMNVRNFWNTKKSKLSRGTRK